MREQIAVLDGLNGLGMSDPYAQDYSGFDSVRETTPVPGGGQNYTGGSDWFERAPYRLQQEGLAGLGNPGGYAGGRTGPVPGNGQNYTGGSSWAEGFPTLPSSEGLAASLTIDEVPGWAGSSVSPVPGGGANYTGGSDWAEGFPTAISSQGLVGLRGMARLRGVGPDMLRSWASCGVINAIRMIGVSRAMGDVAATVDRVMRLGFPRRAALNAKSVSYMAALYTARQVGANMAQARKIARRAMAAC